MSTLRTNAILDASGGTTATVNGIPLRPGVLDPENRIINGAFDFWQRGTSFSNNNFGSDRWYNLGIGGTVTQSRQSFALGDTFGNNGPTYFLRQTVSGQSLSSSQARIIQNIEGVRSYAGQTITVLGWARRSSGSGNMAVQVAQSFGTGGSPSAVVDGAGQTVTLTSSWAAFAVTIAVPSITGKTLGTNGNDYLGLSFFTSAGSDHNALSNSLGLQTIGVDLWGIHIKQGTHTTSAVDLYRQPELGPELARCQRYCFLVDATNNADYDHIALAQTTSTTNARCAFYFPVTMRDKPAVSATSNGFALDWSTGAITVSSIGIDRVQTYGASLSATVASGLSANGCTRLIRNISANPSRITFDSEL